MSGLQLKDHPTEGLLLLFGMHWLYRCAVSSDAHGLRAPYEDRSFRAILRTNVVRELGLFSRIVAVADGFDAGTSVRSYQYEPWPPDEVLKEMRDNPSAWVRSTHRQGADHVDRECIRSERS